MALYFKETEITNIDNFVPQSSLDITDMWFGSTNVYTVWATYEGTLSATINANGDNMRQYQIYGATGGVGDRTVNLFDLSTVVASKYIDSNGNEQTSGADPSSGAILHHSDFFPVEAGQEYVLFSTCDARYGGTTVAFCWYDADKNFLSRTITALPRDTSATKYSFNGIAPQNASFSIANFVSNNFANVMITPGTTPPENYVPSGYEVDISTEKPIIYGFRINPNDPNSYTAVTYLEDAVGKTPAAMGSTAFSYGDWANAFFMPKPCMLKYDGTVDYYLNPNDYSQKADGTASDYNNLAYGGNAMVEFPLIWYKFVQGAESGEGYFYCSNCKIDDSYKCFSNLDCDGNIIEHFYMPIYNGCTYDGKMRSISGLQLSPWSTTAYSSSSTYAVGNKVNYNGRMWKCTTAVETAEAFDPAKWEQFAFNGQTTGTEEINYAKANNTTEKVEWYTNVLCDRQLINALLVLLSKSLDTQGSFGRGIDTGGQTAKEAYVTGSLDDKGLFYGSIANGSTAVKVFGIENWWSLVWHRTAGLIGGSNNTYLYKMTYSTSDGSTANGYNTDGTGYLSIGNKPTTNNYIEKMQYGLWGCLPIETGSYSTQFFRDYWYDGTGYALFGGHASAGANDGAFCANLNNSVRARNWIFSSDLSCKPCRVGNLSKNLENATVTSIYIGSDPLGKDEYVDYQSGKVYRRTDNLFNIDDLWVKGQTGTGNEASIFLEIPVENGTYTAGTNVPDNSNLNIASVFIASSLAVNPSSSINGVFINRPRTITTTTGKLYIGIRVRSEAGCQAFTKETFAPYYINVVSGTSVPTAAIPYLQPTDPPVSLPALPTCEGMTIVDYAGSGTVPEKVLLKYRKEGF